MAKRAVLQAVRNIDSRVSPVDLSSTEERLRATFAIQHFASRTMSAFSAIAMVLGFVSLHVLVRSIGTARRREIAIRAALGADRLIIARWFASEIGMSMLGAAVLGAVGLWTWFSIMSAYVLGIVASDAGLVVAVVGATCAVAFGSAIASGVRAGYRSPVDALRQE